MTRRHCHHHHRHPHHHRPMSHPTPPPSPMQRVAQQLVPEMNRVTAAHDEKRARLTRGLERAVDDAEAATLRAEIAQEGRLHDAAPEELRRR